MARRMKGGERRTRKPRERKKGVVLMGQGSECSTAREGRALRREGSAAWEAEEAGAAALRVSSVYSRAQSWESQQVVYREEHHFRNRCLPFFRPVAPFQTLFEFQIFGAGEGPPGVQDA